MPKDIEKSISQMTGDELIAYLHILSQRQAQFSNLKVKLTEDLTPIEQARAAKRAEIQAVIERQRQCKIEIAACKYAIKGESQ